MGVDPTAGLDPDFGFEEPDPLAGSRRARLIDAISPGLFLAAQADEKLVTTGFSSTGDEEFYAVARLAGPPPAAAIDLRPRSPENRIVATPLFPVSVALLGSPDFDVLGADVTQLRFGPGAAVPIFDLTRPLADHLSLRDVNADGELHRVLTFLYQDTGFPFGESEACLDGVFQQRPFTACDTVLVLPPGCGLGWELALLLPAVVWLRGRRDRRRSQAMGIDHCRTV